MSYTHRTAGRRVLTRAEASAIAREMRWTGETFRMEIDHLLTFLDTSTPEGCKRAVAELQRAARRVGLEADIRSGSPRGWWGVDSPTWLDMQAAYSGGDCPESFPLTMWAAIALETYCAEYLPELIAEADRDVATALEIDLVDAQRHRTALGDLALRFGIKIEEHIPELAGPIAELEQAFHQTPEDNDRP
ncbi:MAG: hypothetical protein ACR2LK_14130 [Solirubrobacteraceae bacterium]